MVWESCPLKHDKYIWWGLVGLGVAVFLWYLTSKQIDSKTQTQQVNTPVLVPTPLQNTNGASPTASTTLSEQQNIVGSHPNSSISNGTNTGVSSANFAEAPGTWNLMPNMIVTPTGQPTNNVNWAAFSGESSPATSIGGTIQQ